MERAKLVVLMVVLALVCASSVGVAQEASTEYSTGTYLLFREYDRAVTVVPMVAGPEAAALPTRFDWGTRAQNPFGRNIVSPVRDQEACGSCWAFASVAALEAWANVKYGVSNVDLSEEFLVKDCCLAGDCGGGYLYLAADFLVSTGTFLETCWPYTATNGPCSGYCADPMMGRTESWAYACGNWWTIDIAKIKQALVSHGPLVTAMDVYSDFDGYAGGVYRHTTGYYRGGHAILLTGYVDDAKYPGGGYFIAKNSWGNWGPYGGYFAIAYDSNCSFGIETTYYNTIIVY